MWEEKQRVVKKYWEEVLGRFPVGNVHGAYVAQTWEPEFEPSAYV